MDAVGYGTAGVATYVPTQVGATMQAVVQPVAEGTQMIVQGNG